jgi:N-acetylmuramoyl-L-alanine amidase
LRPVFIAFYLIVAAVPARAADPAQVPYQEALAKEQALRAAENPTPAEYRAVIRAYETIVRRYPSSAFSDNALWQAAGLARESHAKAQDPQDLERAVRLLRSLVTEYPSSKLVPSAVVEIARMTDTDLPVDPPPTIVEVIGPVQGPRPQSTPLTAPTGVASPRRRPPATIKAINRIVLPEVVRVVVELDAEVSFHHERIENPSRVFVDLHGARATPALRDATLSYEDDVVRKVRIGRHPPDTTRVVLDVENLANYSFFTLYGPYRLVIDCERKGAPIATTRAPVSAPAAAAPIFAPARPGIRPVRQPNKTLYSKPLTSTALMLAPVAEERTIPDGIRVRVDNVVSVPAPPSPAPPRPPASNGAGGFSISRQLGLSASRIVIDPGHGGHDPGALTNGISEAELVLDVALRLEELLRQQPNTDVILTRRSDAYVPLEERTAQANREGADLFLSIHANASRNTRTRGIETYFLNFATTADAEAVAARENIMSAKTMNSLPDIVKAITLNNKRDESKDFATLVQRSLVRELRTSGMKDLGVKQAPFVVLIGAEMPSILAEIAFITNRQDQQQLKKPAYRQRIAEALLNGVLQYQQALKRGTKKVAQQ